MDNEFYELVLGNASSSAEALCPQCGLRCDQLKNKDYRGDISICPLPNCERRVSDDEFEERWRIAVREGMVNEEQIRKANAGYLTSDDIAEIKARQANARRLTTREVVADLNKRARRRDAGAV